MGEPDLAPRQLAGNGRPSGSLHAAPPRAERGKQVIMFA